ncbi:isochorismate synthase [Oceanobacillus polygoni]|uniref:Isochorismate synthase MenF n=1 Tax=Oceanobacillus polygoni TaxID=1235259 RepID=A0A9X1CB06_9BACI|nr:isochorismate synthase [Oceanobacillus polygoni]MBP2076436.1 menaquinone-specific isochorismate synthase [Oceanobacillus polygoni]
MIEIKEDQIASLLKEAIEQLRTEDDRRLVSFTKKIATANPLQFFEAAKHIRENRAFWTSSSQMLWLTGVGTAFEMGADESRFEVIEAAWNKILNEAYIHNPYEVPGTGIVAIGGMSFDPENTQTELWKKFRPSQFRIPEFLLTKYDSSYYLTINVCVRKNDHAKQLAEELRLIEQKLLTERALPDHGLYIQDENEMDSDKWMDIVRRATEEIRKQNVEKIVLARELRLTFNRRADISPVLNNLLKTQPNSYIFAYEIGDDCFVGATPERLVKVEKNKLLSTCLAGTAPRGETKEEDMKISEALLNDEKNRQEHDFVVQMIKRGIKDYCTQVAIPDEPIVRPFKNLQHLYTPVTAQLKDGYTILDIVKQLHPTPALGGSPKEESLAFIREHELLDRGWYGAPIGWMDSSNNGEFAVAIRSALIQKNQASLFAGCGVVKDSDPQSEYEETKIKLLPMLTVLGG